VQQRRKQLSVKRNGGKTGGRFVKKKARMTKEKVDNVYFAHSTIILKLRCYTIK